MTKPKIIVHSLVKNEDQWIWYSLKSILNLADKVLIFDTGSQDKTVEIIKSISSPKIEFHQENTANLHHLSQIKQKMIDMSAGYDWILIVDGDEIWPKAAIREIREFIKSPGDIIAGIHYHWNWIGDTRHYLPSLFGRYQIAGLRGNLTIRLMKNLSNLKVYGEYTKEGYEYNDVPVQDVDPVKLYVFKYRYFHATFLPRSSICSKLFQRKTRYQIGPKLSRETNSPEVFKLPRPLIVPPPINSFTKRFLLISIILTCMRYIKHFIIIPLFGAISFLLLKGLVID